MIAIDENKLENQRKNQPTSDPILVIGASGNVGQAVVKSLYRLGFKARAAALNERDEANVPAEADETVWFDFGEPQSYGAAFEGVKKMFLMRPPAISDVETNIKPVIQFAASAGVEHIAFLSLMGVESKSYVPHYKVEQFIEASGIPYTFLRAGFFMQNLDTTHRADIVEYDDIFVPAGDAQTAFVDARDIGTVAALVLTFSGHKNQAYDLTGHEALTYDQVADIFSDVLGRKITYSRPSMLRFAWRMKKRGFPLVYVIVTAVLFFSARRGSAETVTDEVEQLLGRPPITMRQHVEDYAYLWQKANSDMKG